MGIFFWAVTKSNNSPQFKSQQWYDLESSYHCGTLESPKVGSKTQIELKNINLDSRTSILDQLDIQLTLHN